MSSFACGAARSDAAPARSLLLGEDLAKEGGEGLRARFERMIFEAQDAICAAVAAEDGTEFREDTWEREGGGGGRSRVLQDGKVWEKAGVNVSVVYGRMPASAYRAASRPGAPGAAAAERAANLVDPAASAREAGSALSGLQENGGAGAAGGAGNDASPDKATTTTSPSSATVPFFAAGISSVMHPRNPHCPTMHFNFRYFETGAHEGHAPRWWFGGGVDLTPCYLVEEDVVHFHRTLKDACDKHDAAFYPDFKVRCDDYFRIAHRGETRGLGGVFYDDLADRPADQLVEFSRDLAAAVVPAYVPLVHKHRDDPVTERQKRWQQLRRGRYVEFNLVYDRGTTFGLKTGGRVESILMSMPLTARWEYDAEPEEGSPEAEFLDACKVPRTWIK